MMVHRTDTLRLALAMACAPVLSTAIAQDAPPRPGFGVKADEADTGSNLKRSVILGPLPYDKTYAELSAEQQRMLKSRYVQMAESDEPPFPADGLGPLHKAILRASEIARVGTGKLEMEILVDASGAASRVEVLQSPDAKLSQYAGNIAMLTKFKPAICNGKPCAMGFPVSIVFERR
ncbi:MAG: hypothetical protein JWQ07_1430 [Ramlibacter sp.]|nr:hypothetical protein [Ramlibacter sp.]